ncbi:hypothetical protein GDO86_018902 [Hymenochirus boettgeri]|uniref:Uncharacterized protein n=1 Tax=Hymenochirus boettgeri TaxID=247094 RepID=A0A8T2ICV7_9PIPI|nr:hypothetical protein GDO86_018902 [Hymenochirus boettgeri]
MVKMNCMELSTNHRRTCMELSTNHRRTCMELSTNHRRTCMELLTNYRRTCMENFAQNPHLAAICSFSRKLPVYRPPEHFHGMETIC